MTAEHLPEPLSFRDIVAEGLRRCHAGETTIVVAHDLARHSIEPAVEQHLVGLGIARVLDHALAHKREQLGSVDTAVESEAVSDRPLAALRPSASKMLRMYASADGMRKTLLAFTLPDWLAFRAQAVVEEAAWGRLAVAATIAIVALQRTGKQTTADLPRKEKRAILEALP